jgi:hypothetical protein
LPRTMKFENEARAGKPGERERLFAFSVLWVES